MLLSTLSVDIILINLKKIVSVIYFVNYQGGEHVIFISVVVIIVSYGMKRADFLIFFLFFVLRQEG